MEETRRWTLEGVRAVLEEIRTRTERAVRETEMLLRKRDESEKDSSRRAAVEVGIQEVVERWTREMEALGADVKGLWLIDFDNGSGYYCWKHPEPSLDYYHTYEEGFTGRVRIQ